MPEPAGDASGIERGPVDAQRPLTARTGDVLDHQLFSLVFSTVMG
jgi:hypothetical protein